MQERTIGNCHVTLFPSGSDATGFTVTPPNGDTRTGTEPTFDKAVASAEHIARLATLKLVQS